MRGISDTGYGITIDLGDLVHGTIDKYAEMGAPEQEVAQSRQHADALLESMKRLLDWRERMELQSPRDAD